MKRDDSVYLRHISDAIAKIEQYLLGMTEEAFSLNSMVQDAVIRQIEIIGEATKRLSSGLRSENPQAPGKTLPECATNSSMNTLALTWNKCGSHHRKRHTIPQS